MKECKGKNGCDKLKHNFEFQNDKRNKDGLFYICKNCQRKYNRKYSHNQKVYQKYVNTLKGRAYKSFWGLKTRCKKNNIEFNLTKEWFYTKLKNNCEVSGLSFDFKFNGKRGPSNPYTPSVDRINPLKGYTTENCRMVLTGVNGLKFNGTDEDLFKIAEAIHLQRVKKLI